MSLSPEQQKAVDSESPSILMMAGPGSGKTHTLIARTRALLERDAHPSQMVVITFTNEAADELKRRSDLDFKYCGTLHGFMLRILQEFGHKIGLTINISVMTEDMRDEMLTALKKQNGFTRGTKKEINEALSMGPWTLSDMLKNGESLSKSQTVALSYYQQCRAESVIDYDSILFFGLEVARKLDFYDLKVLYLFVDEYQDSSGIDALIYDALPVTDRFYIGDPDQSIYAFRGADLGNIIELAEERPDTEVLALEDNYRCDQEITRAAQHLIEHNQYRPQKATRSVTGAEGKVLFHEPFSYDLEELIWVAQEINKLPDPAEVAVLVRTNKLVEFFRDGLRGHSVQIPVVRHAQLPDDYKRTLLYLSLLCNPENDRLAYAWLCKTNKAKADTIKMEALAQFTSINKAWLHLPTEPDLADVIGLLRRESTSFEMIARIEDTTAKLPDHYSLAELVSALQYEQPKERGAGVTVTTMHSAKGREWDHVFLPALEQGVIPSKSKNATLEEERRLMFVAMTRARHTLTLSSSIIREDPWTHRETTMQPSQFLEEVESLIYA